MSTSLSLVTSDNRQWSVTRPAPTILQNILEDACIHFTLDAATHRLEQKDARGNARPVDHTLSIRMAQLPANSQLHIVHCPTQSSNVHLTISLPGQQPATINAVFPVTSTILAVLTRFSSLHPTLRLSDYAGVPPAEQNERFSVHINVPGTMQTVVDTGCKRVVGDDALAATTLAQLGMKGEEGGRAGKGRLRLTHEYKRPEMTEADQAAVMQRFSSTLNNAVQEIEQKRNEKAAELAKQQSEEAALRIPADRRLRVLQAQPGLLPAPELPDEFYEVTEEDSVEYARSVMRQAAKERGDPVPPASTTGKTRKRPVMSLVRVKLPSHVYVEGVFKAGEHVSDIREWLLSHCIREDVRAVVSPLFVTPPKHQLGTSKTLREGGLLGSVMLHASINGQDVPTVRRGRENVLQNENKSDEEETKEEKEAPPPQSAQADVVYTEWTPEMFLSAQAMKVLQAITPPSAQAAGPTQLVAASVAEAKVEQSVT